MNVNQFKEVHNIFLHMILSLGSRNLEILKQYWILSYEHITLNLKDMAENFFVTNYERDELITIIREAFGAELTEALMDLKIDFRLPESGIDCPENMRSRD
jgi:hypothetical protein